MNNDQGGTLPNAVSQPAILVVDDDRDILTAARMLLRDHFKTVTTLADPQQILPLLVDGDYPLVLLDMNFTSGSNSGEEGFYWLGKILEQAPDTVVVMMTAFGDVDTAVRAIKQGATDFVLKPWHNDKVLATLASAEQLCRSRRQIELLKTANRELSDAGDLIGHSPSFRRSLQVIERAAPTDANVLITGETAPARRWWRAKFTVVRHAAIRYLSALTSVRCRKICLRVSCSATKRARSPERDATASVVCRPPMGERCSWTRSANLPLHLQSKLLTALERRQVIPVGGNKPGGYRRAVTVGNQYAGQSAHR